MTKPVTDDRGALETKPGDISIPETGDANENQDDFSDAFSEAAEVGAKADLSAADDPANVRNEVQEKTPPVPPSPTPPAEIPSTSTQQPGESEETYQQRWNTLKGIHKHDKETWESDRATLLSQIEEARKPVTPPAPTTPTTPESAMSALYDSLTEEQKEALQEYEQDFDVVSKMEGIKREVELKKLRKEFEEKLTEISAQLSTQFSNQVAPALELAEATDIASHFSTIQEAHEDFETYRDDGSIAKWIESKPKYVQSVLRQTYEKGIAEDVIDLIADFKRENNITTTIQDESNVIPINQKKAAKKQALTPVVSRRGAVNAAMTVADDFEGAFEEAMNKR